MKGRGVVLVVVLLVLVVAQTTQLAPRGARWATSRPTQGGATAATDGSAMLVVQARSVSLCVCVRARLPGFQVGDTTNK